MLEVAEKPAITTVPGWFLTLTDIHERRESRRIEAGGRFYGELTLAYSPRKEQELFWRTLQVQGIFLLAGLITFCGLMAPVISQALRPLRMLRQSA